MNQSKHIETTDPAHRPMLFAYRAALIPTIPVILLAAVAWLLSVLFLTTVMVLAKAIVGVPLVFAQLWQRRRPLSPGYILRETLRLLSGEEV